MLSPILPLESIFVSGFTRIWVCCPLGNCTQYDSSIFTTSLVTFRHGVDVVHFSDGGNDACGGPPSWALGPTR